MSGAGWPICRRRWARWRRQWRFVQIDLAGGIYRQRTVLRRAALGALGARQFQRMLLASSGAVRMKITTSTSITSTSGSR